MPNQKAGDHMGGPAAERGIIFKRILINPVKTERIRFIKGLSAYRAVNTHHFGYKNQSLNVL
jgi:hypothetical protein